MRYLVKLLVAVAVPLALFGCGESTPPRGPGAIQIAASSKVLEPSFFTFGISIDNGTPHVMFPSDAETYTVAGLAHGDHTIAVTGAPSVCTGAANQTVKLKGDDTAKVVVAINCPRTTGDIKVNASTTGTDLDSDGYLITVDGTAKGSVSSNGTNTVLFIAAGSRSVALSSVAPNCTASAAQTASVTAGGLATLSFTVTCAPVAYIRYTGAATGPDGDADGATISVDGGTALYRTAATAYLRVATGSHTWALADVSPNCTLGGAATGSFTAAGGDTITVSSAMACTAIPQGTAGISIADAAGDTLGNPSNQPAGHDIKNISTRYATGWFILTMRFAKTFLSPQTEAPGALYGIVDIDLDENAATGISPLANSYGGTASQGIDFFIDFFSADTASVEVVRVTSPSTGIVGRVRYKIDADSITFFVPIAKMGNDDGNVTISSIVGTEDRPTDIAPNSGNIVAHVPASPIVAVRSPEAAPEHSPPATRIVRKGTTGKWRR